MYIKVVRPKEDVHMFECRNWHKFINLEAQDSDSIIILDLYDENYSSGNVRLYFGHNDPVVIYVMNNNGKTIETINWQPIDDRVEN